LEKQGFRHHLEKENRTFAQTATITGTRSAKTWILKTKYNENKKAQENLQQNAETRERGRGFATAPEMKTTTSKTKTTTKQN
jgi:hypothetical protein